MRKVCRRSLFVLLLVLLTGGLPAVSPAAETPLIVLLVDTSGSLQPADLGRVQTLVRNLLQNLPPGCEIAVYKFADDSQLVLERTARIQQIEQAIGELRREGSFTALYDAVFDASQYLEGQSSGGRAILLLTDGKNEGGETSLEEGLEIARQRQIPIFTIGVGRAVNRRVLQRIAAQTGGSYAEISAVTGQALAQAMQQALTAPSPAAAAPSPSPSSPPASISSPEPGIAPPPTRQPVRSLGWVALIAALTAAGGGCLWWAFRKPRPSAPGANLDATIPAPPADRQAALPAKDLGTVRAQVPAIPTVRIETKEGSLTVKDGQGVGLIFPVRPNKATTLGRGPTAEVPVQDPTVSNEHCRIVPGGGAYMLYDLKSTNGTRVNGTPIHEHVLRDGDVIQVGNTSFEFRA
jgi:hypothetical protein